MLIADINVLVYAFRQEGWSPQTVASPGSRLALDAAAAGVSA
ncbi:MAG: hypothetical protein ACRDRN_11250 [Sciscionella sp.]